jgi:hypothetical protein
MDKMWCGSPPGVTQVVTAGFSRVQPLHHSARTADDLIMISRAWPPAEPIFELDVPIDSAMFVRHRVLYVITVRQVTSGRDINAWTVQLEVRGDHTWRLTLSVAKSIVQMYGRAEEVGGHVLDAVREWVELPVADRPPFLDVS